MSRFVSSRYRQLSVLWVLLAAMVALVASGGSSARPTAAAAAPPKKATAKQWKALIAKAKQEGSVTIYSIQAPTNLADLAAKFKDKYGINVTVNRKADNDLLPQINAEISSGNVQADVWIATVKRYDRSKLIIGKSWINGSAILGMSWNTQAFPKGIKDIPDFLDPAFRNGKL